MAASCWYQFPDITSRLHTRALDSLDNTVPYNDDDHDFAYRDQVFNIPGWFYSLDLRLLSLNGTWVDLRSASQIFPESPTSQGGHAQEY